MTSQPDDAQAVGRRLAARRTAAGISQTTLATLIGKTGAYVAMIEAGQRNPSLPVVRALADALGCQPGDLLDDDDDEPMVAAS